MTDYYLLTNTLKQKNEELEMMSDRLRKYGENVDEYIRTKERLETKVRIHNEIGQALLTTRRTLNSDDGDLKAVLDIWNRNISVLRMQSEPNNNADYVGELIKAAKSANVEVQIDGQLPEDKDIQQLIVASATEALTNAIRHADAGKLIVEIDSTKKYYITCISNDGKIPDGPVTEGGGLGSLRRRMEKIGGTMNVSWEPQFVLTIKIPKKSGELL
jgi:anti-sigma regulatory factor (Ser/Thr protein kinase)